MKICPNCHAAVQDDAMFCTSCGTSLQQNAASNQPNQNGGHRHNIMRHLLWLRRNTNFSRLTSSIGKTIPTLQTEQDAVTIGMFFL